MSRKYTPLSLKGLKTYSLKGRKSKVKLNDLGSPFSKGSFGDFLNSLPKTLAANNIREIVNSIIKARRSNRPVILGMGAHPIKVGLSPIIIHLMEKGIITAIAMNGACIIHDFELSFIGYTSEDVDREICTGTFGMAEETGIELNQAIKKGVSAGHGIGMAVGEFISKGRFPYSKYSILATAYKINIPATVHVALGTDIIHMHPEADGVATGEGSMRDFRLFASVISDLEGGVYINLGSAVILPEVFLKALSVARNLGHTVKNFTTVNMDFIQHYRPHENVLRRPTLEAGRFYAITGHHEIMFPLLSAAIMDSIKN
ncbi:MAG TPA: hypothetical protein DEP99_02320 [Nitrospiraceae bacterium]|nr:hypothetical protein [Nitrospiraceae bacterium]